MLGAHDAVHVFVGTRRLGELFQELVGLVQQLFDRVCDLALRCLLVGEDEHVALALRLGIDDPLLLGFCSNGQDLLDLVLLDPAPLEELSSKPTVGNLVVCVDAEDLAVDHLCFDGQPVLLGPCGQKEQRFYALLVRLCIAPAIFGPALFATLLFLLVLFGVQRGTAHAP